MTRIASIPCDLADAINDFTLDIRDFDRIDPGQTLVIDGDTIKAWGPAFWTPHSRHTLIVWNAEVTDEGIVFWRHTHDWYGKALSFDSESSIQYGATWEEIRAQQQD